MKKPKAPRVPVLENAFEVNLPMLLRAVKGSGRPQVVLVDGSEHTVAVLSETRLAVRLGGQTLMAAIVAVPCLKDRVRPLLKCPRAHEGNYQSLYWRAGELACRHCHALRYRSNLAASKGARAQLARLKLMNSMGCPAGHLIPDRLPRKWNSTYKQKLNSLSTHHLYHYRLLVHCVQAMKDDDHNIRIS